MLETVTLFSSPRGLAAGSLSFLFQRIGKISQGPTWGLGLHWWPQVGTNIPNTGRTKPTVHSLTDAREASAQGSSVCMTVCLCAAVHVRH